MPNQYFSSSVSFQQHTSEKNVGLGKKYRKQMSFRFWVSQCHFIFCVILPEILLFFKELFKAKLWRRNSYFFYFTVCCKSVAFCIFFLSLYASLSPSLPSSFPHSALSFHLTDICWDSTMCQVIFYVLGI